LRERAGRPGRPAGDGVSWRAGLKIPERVWGVFDQPQSALIFRDTEEFDTRCGWSATQPRPIFNRF
jgi:hypothetical protein